METKKIVMGVISVAVAIIVLMSMIPIFTDAGASEDTFTNKGFFYVDSLDENQSVTYSCDPNGAYVDGVAITGEYATGYSGGASIAYTENFVVRWAGTGPYALRGAYWAYNQTGSASITFNGDGTYSGTYTSGSTTTDISGTFTEFYGLVLENSDRVMTTSSSDKYANGDTIINGTGLSRCVNINEYYVINIEGTIDDGVTVTAYSQLNGSEVTDLVISNIEINKSEVSNYIDLYDIESITFDVTLDDKTDSLTYTVFTLPTEVSAERSVHASPVEATLIGLIPLLMMVGILLTAIGLFIAKYRKN